MMVICTVVVVERKLERLVKVLLTPHRWSNDTTGDQRLSPSCTAAGGRRVVFWVKSPATMRDGATIVEGL